MAITYKVMKTNEFNDSIFYRISCDCSDVEHDLTLEMEWDDGFLTLHFYGDVEVSSWGSSFSWIGKQWWKIKRIFELLFKGYFSVNYEMLILKEEHLDSFIEALQEGKLKFKECKGN